MCLYWWNAIRCAFYCAHSIVNAQPAFVYNGQQRFNVHKCFVKPVTIIGSGFVSISTVMHFFYCVEQYILYTPCGLTHSISTRNNRNTISDQHTYCFGIQKISTQFSFWFVCYIGVEYIGVLNAREFTTR